MGYKGFLVVIPVALLITSCMVRTYSRTIEVTRGASTEERLHLAQSIVAGDRIVRLREQLRERIPALTVEELNSIGIKWRVSNNYSVAGETGIIVSIVVYMTTSFPFPLEGSRPLKILDAATDILESEVSGSAKAQES